MRPIWPRLAAMNLNTLLAPVSWEQVEPQGGWFDFTIVDGLIAEARRHRLRLVLLWFGSWKNSMSSYAQAWAKRSQTCFENGVWQPGRLLNGNESHQGRHVRLPPGRFSIQRVRLYRYR